jgi:hypothetical protein
MAYLGNPVITTSFPVDTFTGNGSTTAFTMSVAPASVNSVVVAVSGVVQDPSTYTISGTTLTFSVAPPSNSGVANISVRHLGVLGTTTTPGAGTVQRTSLGNTLLSTTAFTPGVPVMEYTQTISSNYTISNNTNALSAGPITIDTAATVTIPTGSNWVIV